MGNEFLGVGKNVADNRIAYFLVFEKISDVESSSKISDVESVQKGHHRKKGNFWTPSPHVTISHYFSVLPSSHVTG